MLASILKAGGFSPAQIAALGGAGKTFGATGSTQADATELSAAGCVVTGADGTKGVILPASPVGDWCIVENNSASTLKVYPDSGAAIAVPGTGLGVANASYAHTTFAVVLYYKFSATQWLILKSA